MNEVQDVREALMRFNAQLKSIDEAITPLSDLKASGELERLPKTEFARVNCSVAYSVNALLWMFVRASGVQPSTTPVKKELERVQEVMTKFTKQEAAERGLRVDVAAAGRMIAANVPKDGSAPAPRDVENKPNHGEKKKRQRSISVPSAGKRKRADSSDPLVRHQAPSKKPKGGKGGVVVDH
mmetsp:Transcript_3432/g.12060  ORF Transcript_3432/g.12060 Transcript_3432/m.12060 type:complete len:182 (-) Transcript_3432:860-1405(-)